MLFPTMASSSSGHISIAYIWGVFNQFGQRPAKQVAGFAAHRLTWSIKIARIEEGGELAPNYGLSGRNRLSNCCDNLAAYVSTAAADTDFMLLHSSTSERNALISQSTSKLPMSALK